VADSLCFNRADELRNVPVPSTLQRQSLQQVGYSDIKNHKQCVPLPSPNGGMPCCRCMPAFVCWPAPESVRLLMSHLARSSYGSYVLHHL
jgi:hypothetical protein